MTRGDLLQSPDCQLFEYHVDIAIAGEMELFDVPGLGTKNLVAFAFGVEVFPCDFGDVVAVGGVMQEDFAGSVGTFDVDRGVRF